MQCGALQKASTPAIRIDAENFRIKREADNSREQKLLEACYVNLQIQTLTECWVGDLQRLEVAHASDLRRRSSH
jgi:hypothetical protein